MGDFSRRDFLKVGGCALAGTLVKKGLGDITTTLNLEVAHTSAEVGLRQGLLHNPETVLSTWPDQEGWKDFSNQFESPVAIMQEALSVCQLLGVEPKFIQHGNRLEKEELATKALKFMNQNQDQYDGYSFFEKLHDALSVTGRDSVSYSLTHNYVAINDPVLLDLSSMRREAVKNDGEHETYLNKYVKQIEKHLNLFQKAVDSRGGKPLTYGMMVGYSMAINNGDIMAGVYEATEFCEFLARGQSRVNVEIPYGILKYEKVEGEWKINICIETDPEQSKIIEKRNEYYDGILCLSGLCEDQSSLIVPMNYLSSVCPDSESAFNIDNQLSDTTDYEIYTQDNLGNNTDPLFSQKLLSKFQNTSIKNRSGGYYHFFSIVSLLTFADPEIAASMICYYYGLESKMLINFKHYLNNLSNNPDKTYEYYEKYTVNAQHGNIKMFSDLNTATYLGEIYKLFQQYKNYF